MTWTARGPSTSVCSTREPAGFFDPPGLLFFRAGAVRLLLEQAATSALIYLKVDDVRATIESLRADDVEIVTEPHVIFRHTDDSLGPAGTEEWMAFVKDSEGNTVGLVSHHKPRPHELISTEDGRHERLSVRSLGGRFWQNACRICCRAVPSHPVRLRSTEIIASAPHRVGWDHPERGRPVSLVATPLQE